MADETESPGDILAAMGPAYPQFHLGHGKIGHRGHRWIAERIDSAEPGLHTVITSDLSEFRAALETARQWGGI